VRPRPFRGACASSAPRRIISINAQAPLLQVRPDPPSPRRLSDTAAPPGGSSWRAVNGDTPAPNGRHRQLKGTDVSAHSLRTLATTNGGATKRKTRLGTSHGDGSADDADSTGFGTIRTYRTAQEPSVSGDEDEGEDDETERAMDDSLDFGEGPPPLQAELVPVTEEEDVFVRLHLRQNAAR
jgi:hypothetical protein